MNADETIALEYLQRRGFQRIVYEPNGNVPPDFLVDERIAVEVRRLNQHYMDGHRAEGLEESAYPLHGTICKVLDSMGQSASGKNWYVSYRFERPIPPKRDVEAGLLKLSGYGDEEIMAISGELLVAENLSIRLYETPTRLRQRFVLGGWCDHDAGGWLISELSRNLEICIAEKTNKVKPYLSQISEWWLVLIDRVGYGLDAEDVKQLGRTPIDLRDWSDVVLVNPMNPENWISLTGLRRL